MLANAVYEELDEALAALDAELLRRYPGEAPTRQPVHTVYVSADRFRAGISAAFGRAARSALAKHGPLPFGEDVMSRVRAKLEKEPIEDLRIDFEDGYGVRDDREEDAAAVATAQVVREQAEAPFIGLRCKSLEAGTRRRAIRTLDLFLDMLGPPPDGFVVTLPKVSAVAQVKAMVVLCGHLEQSHHLAPGRLRFEIQVETPPAVLDAGGTATVARMVHAAAGRCVGLHYGTYDYSAACGVAATYQSLDHPAADHAKAVMQVAAAGTGVRVCDGSTNVVPVGDTEAVRAAWHLHARLVRRSLERGFYQGWDLHPAQLPTRFAATYAFYREAAASSDERLQRYRQRRSQGILDEPATARALAGFLLRGLNCGALDGEDVSHSRAELEELWRPTT